MKSASPTPNPWLVVFAFAILLVVRALEVRLPGMERAFWEDEVHHNEPVFASPDMAALEKNGMYRAEFQPIMDFWIRHDFWFPLLGVSERAMRLPALVCGLVCVALVYGVLVALLSRQMSLRRSAVFAFVASLWIVDNGMHVHNSTEARHYALIAFASTLWCLVLFVYRGRPRWLLSAASLLFANTHFFSLPFIAAGYALQLVREVRDRRRPLLVELRILFHLLTCFAIYECTVRFNLVPFEGLLKVPPGSTGAERAPIEAIFALPHFKAGFELWLNYAKALAVPPAVPVGTAFVWCAMLFVAIRRRSTRWAAPLLAVFGVLPVCFVYMRFRSNYPFGDRYFSPFFGMGLVTLIAGIDVGLREWKVLTARLSDRVHTISRWSAGIALAFLFGIPACAYRTVSEVGNLRVPWENGSPYYRAYAELVEDKRPVFLVHVHCFTNDIPRMYVRYILPHHEVPFEITDLWGCEGSAAHAKQELRSFLASSEATHGVVVLDQKEDDCTDRPIPPIDPPAHVEKVRAASECIWKVTGIRTPEQLSRVATALGFRAAKDIL